MENEQLGSRAGQRDIFYAIYHDILFGMTEAKETGQTHKLAALFDDLLVFLLPFIEKDATKEQIDELDTSDIKELVSQLNPSDLDVSVKSNNILYSEIDSLITHKKYILQRIVAKSGILLANRREEIYINPSDPTR